MTQAFSLPEDDQDFLRRKRLKHNLLSEQIGNDVRRGLELPEFVVPENLYQCQNGQLVSGGIAAVLVLIPTGYATTRLDSWYVKPALLLAGGGAAPNVAADQDLFGDKWQFWSRHLEPNEWRPGMDGLETYLQYIRAGFRNP